MRINYARKLSIFIMWLLYVQLWVQNRGWLVWAVMINRPELPTKLKMMHILQAQVCGCISAHPGLSHQKTKRETSDASKRQLNQASWNRKVVKFGFANQLKFNNYLSILFLWFSLDRPLSETYSLPLMSQAGYGPGCSPESYQTVFV